MDLKAYGWVAKDESYRRFFPKFELKKNVLKSLLYTSSYPSSFRMYFEKKIHDFTKKSSISMYRRYGMFNFIGRSVFRKFKLNRHFAKFSASYGYLVGLRKSSF